jgi:hypothetical protein
MQRQVATFLDGFADGRPGCFSTSA